MQQGLSTSADREVNLRFNARRSQALTRGQDPWKTSCGPFWSERILNPVIARIDGGQGNSRYFRSRESDADQIPTDEHRRSESDLGP